MFSVQFADVSTRCSSHPQATATEKDVTSLEKIVYLSSPQTFVKTFLYALYKMHEKLMIGNVTGLTRLNMNQLRSVACKSVHGIIVLSEHQLLIWRSASVPV